jgi:hypothetical protein
MFFKWPPFNEAYMRATPPVDRVWWASILCFWKDTNQTQCKKLQFRAEFINRFNRVNSRQPFSQIG